MSTACYLASAESQSGKSAVAVGLLAEMCSAGGRVGVFRPVVRSGADDPLLDLLLPLSTSEAEPGDAVGVSYDDIHDDTERAVGTVVERYHAYAAQHDAVLVIGSDFTDVPTPTEFSVNATIAVNIGAPMLLVVPAVDRATREVVTVVDLVLAEARQRHARVAGVIANRVDPRDGDELRAALAEHLPDVPVHALPADEVLHAPTVRDVMQVCGGELALGNEQLLDREAMAVIVAAMTMPHVLDRLVEGCVVICPGDREEVFLAALMAHGSSTFPTLAAMVLNGGFELSPQTARLVEGLGVELPVITAPGGTMDTATAVDQATGGITAATPRKIERARSLVHEHLDIDRLLPRGQSGTGTVETVTPLMFEHRLTAAARRAQTRIVLPEGQEDRVLRAAETSLRRGICEVTLLGDPEAVRSRAASLGLHIDDAQVLHPTCDERREDFAQVYAELRAHKGVTPEQARDAMVDPAYFGTMLVHQGQADGMVSGSITTTAQTIRPALEIIRTAEHVSVVSSVFFMCLADRVLVYGDCAINPDPSAEQLADIAISSADTAQQFGVEPLVAMLSYSTGVSGSGADVEKVRKATELVRERSPKLAVEGPIQYDAAVDPSVAATKAKDSAVAGKATVLIFPDLNTGNNTYKAVQRSASAVAIGPVLQGLRKPVNDLSRGATVRDIINTISITAIQAAN
ncbi:MAG: phosphate acetyltransferase [Ornithinimicrobium sp.]|uniref:phosphate acetyltransferase n=1 Tax=Ornithinimicrobium sp. TaxID=1977084 RepID=UPI003D9ABA1D